MKSNSKFTEFNDELNEEIAKRLTQLFWLCMNIQLQTEYCVFFNFSGHIHGASLHICKSKSEYQNRIAEAEVRADNSSGGFSWRTPMSILNGIDEKIEFIERWLEEKEIPADWAEKVPKGYKYVF